MAGTAIKVGAAVVGLSSVTTGSYFIRGYYNTERITHRISNAGMTLLTRWDKEEEWAKRWKDYIDKKTNIWNLKGYDQAKTNLTKVPQEFKDKCLGSSSSAIEGNEALASQVEEYCTKSSKVSDLLKDEKGITLLKKEDNDGLWKEAWGKYHDEKQRSKKNPLDIGSVNRDNLPDNYKTNCLDKANSQIKTKRDEKYSIVKSWCTRAQ